MQQDLHMTDYELWRAEGRHSFFRTIDVPEHAGEDFDIVTERREGWAYD